MIFHVAMSPDGQPSWWLYGANDELEAWAGRYYASLEFAHKEASAFRASASSVGYEIFPHPDGGWGWRAVQPVNYCMVYSARGFPSAREARRVARTVRKAAPRAGGL
ncbi:hypothetical protein [Pseudarthrobacter sp. YAF2]|uniref:hypothetical protein n=1 Tax=Pseudarthrobacter sp. YAF2 TaxID=3233078 RepID=UPI003F9DC364